MVSQNPSNNPAEPLLPASLPSGAKTLEVPVLDGEATVETAAQGNSPINDPAGQDTKPPGVTGPDFLDLLI